ncbi:MAG: fumarylacetoacetate hydrolase family protein [Candidatus Saelkia tenebricola]|nr:fumarylacetoacetate hydrolase family protein [Candidatus Saelkia tenebricola]
MKIVRILYQDKIFWGDLENDIVKIIKGNPFGEINYQGSVALDEIKLLAPVEKNKIVLAGLNYLDHAKELGMDIPDEPIIFLKPNSSILNPDEKIIYPSGVKRLDYEAELALVIKKKGRDIEIADINDFILGYTCLNDVTARDLQSKDIQWTRAKSFDTFCPVGPWIETEIDPDVLEIKCYLNGELKQSSKTTNFIFSIAELVSFISKIMTLYPGDIISTGTPSGVGQMNIGDTVEVEIEGVGRLKNYVGDR